MGIRIDMLKRRLVLRRFPTIKQLAPVFALTFFLFNAWTMFRFFWKLPSWLFFLNVREILAVLAYSFSTNLLESMLVVISLAILAAILPNNWFRDVFIPVGIAIVILILSYLSYFLLQFYSREDYPSEVVRSSPFVIVGIFFLASFLGRIPFFRRIFDGLADRIIVFLYFLLPLGITSLLVVLMQNLF